MQVEAIFRNGQTQVVSYVDNFNWMTNYIYPDVAAWVLLAEHPMAHWGSLFTGTFTTLLAIINPLEALPIFIELANGKDAGARRQLARRACVYAGGLLLFFLAFGNLVLRLFDVPLAMVRMVGGIVLIRIGF